MRIVIAGGTGLIGKALTELMIKNGHEIIILTRSVSRKEGDITYVQWLNERANPEVQIQEAEVFINLAGVSLNDGRWSASHQREIIKSRMTATDEIIRIIKTLPKKPKVLVNASAIGIYPASLEQVYTENSTAVANNFLGKTVYDWEKKATHLDNEGVRIVFVRFGVILSERGSALTLMMLPYKLFCGGTLGSGKQWMSWIHIHDCIRAILFTIENEEIQGPVNVTSPHPVTMKVLGQTIGKVLHRPHWLRVPPFALKFALGKKSALVLEGQLVLPDVLLSHGFQFKFPSLDEALENLLNSNKSKPQFT